MQLTCLIISYLRLGACTARIFRGALNVITPVNFIDLLLKPNVEAVKRLHLPSTTIAARFKAKLVSGLGVNHSDLMACCIRLYHAIAS